MKGDRASGSVRKVSWGNKFIKMIQFVMVLFLQMYLFIRGGYVPKKYSREYQIFLIGF